MRSVAQALFNSRHARKFAVAYAVAFVVLFLFLHGSLRSEQQHGHIHGFVDRRVVRHEGHHVQRLSIPKIIHQTWKTKNLPPMCESAVASWQSLNPDYEYRFYTDEDMHRLVTEDHPELVPLWQRMSGVLRADLFRYLVLFEYGGYYADIDVTCDTPIDDWFKRANIHYAAGLVVGFEVITGKRPDWYKWFNRKHQMCQWVMGSIAGHPVMARTIDHIWAQFEKRTDKEIQDTSATKLTGPAVWSDGITDFLHEEYQVTFGEAPFSDERLRDEYILVGDVLLMPMRAFAVGSAGYTMPSEYPWSDKFVTHGFQGSWKVKPAPEYLEPYRGYNAPVERDYCEHVDSLGVQLCTHGASPEHEGLQQLLDGSASTKWLQFHDFKTRDDELFVTLTAPHSKPFVLTGYSLTAADDFPDRDPTSWAIYAEDSKIGWKLLHEVKDNDFSERGAVVHFDISNTEAYSVYKLTIMGVRNKDKVDSMQLSGLKLDGLPLPPAPEHVCCAFHTAKVCVCCSVDADKMDAKLGPLSAFDGSVLTKWHVQWEPAVYHSMDPVVTLVLERPVTVVGYNVSSADDFPARDPSAWQFSGRNNDNDPWVLLDTQKNVKFEARYDNRTFLLSESVTYQQLRWTITALRDSRNLRCRHTFCTQVSELRPLLAFADDRGVLPHVRAAAQREKARAEAAEVVNKEVVV